MDRVRRVWSGINCKLQSGQGMTEYALILALIAIAGIVTWTALGTKITSVVSSITTSL